MPNSPLAAALANLTHEQAEAVYEALGQYVDNQEDYIAGEDEPDPEQIVLTKHAREVQEKMDAVFIALAT